MCKLFIDSYAVQRSDGIHCMLAPVIVYAEFPIPNGVILSASLIFPYSCAQIIIDILQVVAQIPAYRFFKFKRIEHFPIVTTAFDNRLWDSVLFP